MRLRNLPQRAFTLVEILIVIIILGILAAIVIPQFTQASDDAKESAVVSDLQMLRSQVELYKFQHGGRYPAQTNRSAEQFKSQMTGATDPEGHVGPIGSPEHKLGPYFLRDIPANPYNGGRGVMIVEDISAPSDENVTVEFNGVPVRVGWFFNPATGQIKCNTRAVAADGTPIDQL